MKLMKFNKIGSNDQWPLLELRLNLIVFLPWAPVVVNPPCLFINNINMEETNRIAKSLRQKGVLAIGAKIFKKIKLQTVAVSVAMGRMQASCIRHQGFNPRSDLLLFISTTANSICIGDTF